MKNVIDITGKLPKRDDDLIAQESFVFSDENSKFYAGVLMGPFKTETEAEATSNIIFDLVEESIKSATIKNGGS